MWQKLFVVILYLSFVFLFLRGYEWYFFGLGNSHNFVHPLTLNAKKLHSILDERGVLYATIFEKKDLVSLVEASGGTVEADIKDAEETLASAKDNTELAEVEEQVFTGSAHFFEQVEDCKDSAWLIQIIAINGPTVLSSSLWKELAAKLRPYGIRFGILDCRRDPLLCSQRQWNTSRLLLALPLSNELPKANVRLIAYRGKYRFSSILQWIYRQVGSNVRHLKSKKELSVWIADSCAADVCFLLVSTLTLPPFFLSALSVKFSGRAKFATATPDGADMALGDDSQSASSRAAGSDDVSGQVTAQTKPPQHRLNGRYWLMSPQGRARYGADKKRSRFEKLKFENLYAYLRWFAPDLNDLFIFSLAAVNLCAVVSIFDLRGSPSQAIFHFAWTLVKYNTILLIGWIILLSLAQRQMMIGLGKIGLNALRRFSLSGFGRIVIGDLQTLVNHCCAWIVTFVMFNGIVYYFRRRFFPYTLEEPEPWSEWFRLQRPIVVLNPGRPMIYRSRSPDFNPRVRTLIRQLGLSEYTVNPSLAFDFLFELPVWTYDEKLTCPTVNGNHPVTFERVHVASSELCVRCRCVRALRLKNLARKLARRPCSHCGYAGNLATRAGRSSHGQEAFKEEQVYGHIQACPICLDPYVMKDLVCGLPCGHSYHRNCILSWLITDPHQTCPCCRWPAYIERGKVPPIDF